ncbi:sulfotransferase family protein [Desulfatirhabdium butyrativorans]|uniref:sulfotransferase family protein n=1 Tax=Desulfatirhabdium butyrativorans TaxID=340467 RepID=UPI0003F559FA|nr:sulfotransferase [Desulfatirhabdium butyrativorans]
MNLIETLQKRCPTAATEKWLQRWWPLDAGKLCSVAKRQTGLNDFGDPPVETALSILVNSLQQEAGLHPVGHFLIWHHLKALLATRLRLVHAWRNPVEVLNEVPIERPLFITGMPRSGSTFLHELLAVDPGNRSPLTWEVMFPLPERKAAADGRDARIRHAAAQLRWFRRIVPEADIVHPIHAESPQECVAVHSYSMRSEEFLITCWLPAYENWLRKVDFVPVYAWQKRFLQHLQGSGPARRWVLKAPDHAHTISALFTVFPDARIVQTHRNPPDVLRSILGLAEVLHGLYGRAEGAEKRARRQVRVMAEAMDRLMDFRQMHPELEGRFLDIHYSDLVADPMKTIEAIYRHCDTPLTEQVREGMRRMISQRSRYPKRRGGRAGRNVLSVEESRPFLRYCRRFGFPLIQGEYPASGISSAR